MNKKFGQMVEILEEAQASRERRPTNPSREPDETTEDDIVLAMLRHKMSSAEILEKKGRLTELLRLITKRNP